MSARLLELVDRLVAPGPKAAHVSASETHEITEGVHQLLAECAAWKPATIHVRVADIQPHPDQATRNPGDWAVKLVVTHAERTHTFWRWYTVRKLNENGAYLRPDPVPPTHAEVIQRFWDDTFAELHGFSFEEEVRP